jgi:hypothetical protein
MNAVISTIKGIGPLATEIFQQAGYNTLGDLYRYDSDDRRIMEVIDSMKLREPRYPKSYWKRVCTRCINFITLVKNAKAIPVYPYHLICPISQDLMSDPVIAPSGISYDRISIEEWLSTNDTEPSTRSVLTVEQLYPNRYLKEAIEHYRNNYQMYCVIYSV